MLKSIHKYNLALPDRIKRLVYLDGYIPEDGKTAFDLIPGLEAEYKKRSLRKQGKGWLVQSYDPTVCGVTNLDDIAWMNRHLSPMPFHTYDQSIGINNPEARIIPKSYISCTDKDFNFMAQKAWLGLS